jgi:heme oxygenase
LLRRYAAFYIPADDALACKLACLPELDFKPGSRSAMLASFAAPPLPAFPSPASPSEALGLFYVLEGSTLGGRLILRELARRGVDLADLTFLDPYGTETGARWRSFLAVLERETGFGDERRIEEAERGAVRGFAHAERILCGDMP